MDGKKWYTSKTLWFNSFASVIYAAGLFSDSGLFTNPKVLSGLGLTVAIGNKVLRLFTDSPITK